MKFKIDVPEDGKIVFNSDDFRGKKVIISIEEDNPKQIIYERNFYRGRVLGDLASLLYTQTGENQSNETLNEYLKSICNPVVGFGARPQDRQVVSGSTTAFTPTEWANYNERCKRMLNSKLGLFQADYLYGV